MLGGLALARDCAYIASESLEDLIVTVQALTANEAAAASRVPLKHVHRIIDAGLLGGAVESRSGTRLIDRPGLLALKLAYVTANVLKPEARRRAVRTLLERPGESVLRDQAVTVEVEALGAELEEGLAELEAAKTTVRVDPEIMGGSPCFDGTRIPIHDVAEMLADGETMENLLRGYPALDEGRIRLAPIYAAAYPRRGRPPTPPWRKSPPISSYRTRLEDLPPA